MEVRELLRELDLRPQRHLGQNFLVDRRVLDRLLATAEVSVDDTVLEIGAGLGILTQALAERARHVVAVEIDQQLAAMLRERLGAVPQVSVVEGDILNLDINSLLEGHQGPVGLSYKVVANIPYYITSAVLRRLLENPVRPALIVLMVQKEVAQRIVARPGQMSLLALSVQFYGKPRLVASVSARSFYPAPKVDSAIIRIDPHDELPLAEQDISPFFDLLRAGFAQRRKQLRNALSHGLGISAELIGEVIEGAGIDGRRRAQTLSVSEWLSLYRALGRVSSGARGDGEHR